ncbi:cytochrome P450 3A16-like [Daphnia pulex]|uniref:cytochrome P450 3A16-like n=1 Tax=Daphnia pulex TaxID=6669 RepID=UPI001EE04917|nr:cytochrome P450 3A16-like [Daphnia pulex]
MDSDAFSSILSTLFVASLVLFLLYRYMTSTFTYFSERGIPGPKPIPIFGNLWGIWRVSLPDHDRNLVKKYGKIFGYFDGSNPSLWVTDPEFIKAIFVKDFDHFTNRRNITFESKVVRRMVSSARGQEWKDIRSSITPAFTTGKIKRMSVLIKNCADRMAIKFDNIATSQGKLDAKIQFSAFTMDVIARCAFGMTIDSLGEKDDPFMTKAKAIFNPPVNKTPLAVIPFIYPKLIPLLGERVFLTEGFQFFIRLLENLIKERKESEQKYKDFVEAATETITDYTKEVDGKSVPKWSSEEINEIVIAQSVLFLLAGFDTTATTLTNIIFLLALNPEIQNRLHQEITNKLKISGEVNHDILIDFPYIDQVINEVLRVYPPVPRVERECNKDVTYNGIEIKKGTMITVPSFALHYDPDSYPDPETFNPDRWSADNKAERDPYTFLPFGMGPRNCVGMRFAMEEIKIALCTIVSQFRFFRVRETPEKMQFDKGFIQVTQPVNAIVGIERRPTLAEPQQTAETEKK